MVDEYFLCQSLRLAELRAAAWANPRPAAPGREFIRVVREEEMQVQQTLSIYGANGALPEKVELPAGTPAIGPAAQ